MFINITDVGPTFSNSTWTSTQQEGSTGTVFTANATDINGGTPVYSLTGTDASLFNINSSTGVVSFKTAPDFENPLDSDHNNSYLFNIVATTVGGVATTTSPLITLTVTDVPITFSSGTTASTPESVPTSTAVYTAVASDTGGSPIYSLSGTDAALFNINASTGAVTFKTSPNFEAPTDNGANNVYNFDVKATQGSQSATRSVALTVTNVAPTLASSAVN
ncbi:MAG: hypothetical protein O7C62_01220, partial [Rickettsia endosymbiont of Ixodes persulcatus]|nr:hypothetical protein [Rickettsia endosymbiont of Ixodes persulcatus]